MCTAYVTKRKAQGQPEAYRVSKWLTKQGCCAGQPGVGVCDSGRAAGAALPRCAGGLCAHEPARLLAPEHLQHLLGHGDPAAQGPGDWNYSPLEPSHHMEALPPTAPVVKGLRFPHHASSSRGIAESLPCSGADREFAVDCSNSCTLLQTRSPLAWPPPAPPYSAASIWPT